MRSESRRWPRSPREERRGSRDYGGTPVQQNHTRETESSRSGAVRDTHVSAGVSAGEFAHVVVEERVALDARAENPSPEHESAREASTLGRAAGRQAEKALVRRQRGRPPRERSQRISHNPAPQGSAEPVCASSGASGNVNRQCATRLDQITSTGKESGGRRRLETKTTREPRGSRYISVSSLEHH